MSNSPKLSESAPFDDPFDQFLYLNPSITHRLAVQHYDDEVLVGRSQTWTSRISNASFYPVETILQQLIRVLVRSKLWSTHYLSKERVAHELTSYLSDFVASRDIFKLVICIVSMAVEKTSIQSSQPHASLVHHSNKQVSIVLVCIGCMPLLVFRVHHLVPCLEKAH